MELLSYIFSFFLIVILVLSFIKIKYGVALFLAYMILVPHVRIHLGPLSFGSNLFTGVFLIAFFLYVMQRNIKLKWKPLTPFFIWFALWLIMMLFQPIPAEWMLNQWRRDTMGMLILPFFMYNMMIYDSSSIKLFRNIFVICIVVAIGYGLILTQLGGVNPYQMACEVIFKEDLNGVSYENYYLAESGGRMFGRISSTYRHPMSFALFQGMAFIYIYSLRDKLHKYFYWIMLAAIALMIICCGVRSVIGGIIVALAYYLFMRRSFKLMVSVLIIGFVGMLIVEQIPDMAAYLGSIGDVNNKTGAVAGSSVEMRLGQLAGAIKEASKNPLFGLGYGWTQYYQSLHGDHPICLAFESLIFVAICNGGILGCALWIFLILSIMRNNNRISHSPILLNTLLFFWISNACITGEYGYMKTFILFYIVMIGDQMETENKKVIISKR